MKKVKIAFIGLMLLGFTAGVYAQEKKDAAVKSTKPSKPAKSTAAKSTAKADKNTPTKADNSAPAKASKSATPAKDKGTQHLKKDGTPDMRYKENKKAAPAADKK